MSPRRALVVIDVQQEYFDGPLQVQHPPREESMANIIRALDVATEHGLPVVVVQHEELEGSPVFAAGSAGWTLHPEVEKRLQPSWKRVTKSRSSVFAGTDVAEWLDAQGADTITVVGHMTNNCDIATAFAAEALGLAAEVLSDATGAIHLVNEMGKVRAEVLHEVLLVLLHSNVAAVASAEACTDAVRAGRALPTSNLVTSAIQGSAAFAG